MVFGLLFTLIMLSMVVMAYSVFNSRIGFVAVPFFCAGILLLWFTPQALLVINDVFLPNRGILIMFSMALASLICAIWGWSSARSSYRTAYPATAGNIKTPLYLTFERIPDMRLYAIAGALTVFAALVQIAILRQPPETLLSRQPTGLITILKMFSTVNPMALFLSLSLFLYRRNLLTLGLVILAFSNFIVPILVSFKRNEIVELGAVVVFALWSMKRFSVPRASLPFIAILSVLILFGAGAVRKASGFSQTTSGEVQAELVSVEAISEISWADVITEQLGSKSTEVGNGIYMMDYAVSYEVPTFGARFWNQFITRWVPGQFVGADLKQSLLLDVAGVTDALDLAGLSHATGTTSTGFTEIFLDFSYFAAFLFFIMAFHTRRCYDKGLAGDLACAAVYPSLAILCVVSFTHGGYSYFLTLPLVFGVQFGIQMITNQRKPARLKKADRAAAVPPMTYSGYY